MTGSRITEKDGDLRVSGESRASLVIKGTGVAPV